MPITGVFFVPATPNAPTALAALTERLRYIFADEPVPVGRWALEHKLMRDTPSCLPASAHAPNAPPKPKFMQFLSLTHYPSHGFIYTSEPTDLPPQGPTAGPGAGNVPGMPAGAAGAGAPSAMPQQQQMQTQQAMPTATTAPGAVPTSAPAAATVLSVPSQPQPQQPATANPNTAVPAPTPMIMRTVPLPSYGTLFQHFVRACEPMWCHRHTVSVPAGIVYDVGDFRVRMGDVRQTQPVARVRGTVVEIEWKGPSLSQAALNNNNNHNNHNGWQQEEDGNGSDSGIDLSLIPELVLDESAIDEEYTFTAQLIREFWARLGIEGAREAILVPDVGKEVKELLRRKREEKEKGAALPKKKKHRRRATEEGTWGWGDLEEDPDPNAGVDLARQYMEIFRFNR